LEESNLTRKQIKAEEKVAANSLRTLVYSIAMNVEDKVVLEDMINKLSQEADTMLDIINDIPKKYHQDLLIGYKTLLQSSIDAVNRRITKL
jgi:phage terminase Nu1 subunit (DNA packaging protein)